MKLQSFSLANFKAFGTRLQEVPLKPVTLVFGPNSAGKSSLLQALMYFHEVLETGEMDVVAPRAGRGGTDLGGFFQVLHRRGELRHIVLGLSFPVDILSDEDQRRWPMEKGFSLSFTLGPVSDLGELGTHSVSLEIDGQELLRATHGGEGPMKVNLFDFTHPAMKKMLSVFPCARNTGPASPDDNDNDNAEDEDEDEDYWNAYDEERMFAYLDFAVRKGHFSLPTFGVLPRTLRVQGKPNIHAEPNEDLQAMMHGFEESNEDWLEHFFKHTLPDAFRSLFEKFQKQALQTMNSLRYVPPIRDLPPRGFNPNQHSDPAWRRLAREPDLRERVNRWLGSDFMNSRYTVEVRELAPLDEILSGVPQIFESELINLFGRKGFSGDLQSIMEDLEQQFEELDKVHYAEAHPDLYEEIVANEISIRMDMAEDNRRDAIHDEFLGFSDAEKRDHVEGYIENIINDSTTDEGTSIWEHFKAHSQVLVQFVSDKLDLPKIAGNFTKSLAPTSLERRKEIVLMELPTRIKVSLQDVGVGISQVLPVLINAFGEKHSFIAVEQPEIHIHPALQAEMGDVFLESALGENRNTFLLETHSEHLILRILRRIRETTENEREDWPEALKAACPNGIRPEDVAVLYVEPGEDGATVVELPVTPDGDFARPWPNGFFAERGKELF